VAGGAEGLEDVHAVDLGHLEVEQDEVERVRLEPHQGGLAVLGRGERVVRGRQGGAEDEADVGLVVDDQDPRGGAHNMGSPLRAARSSSPEAAGRVKENVVPRPGSLSTATWPPWATTTSRTIARPRPAPPGR